MVLAFGDVSHFLHRASIGEDVPLAPQMLVAEEVEQPLRRHGKPDGRGSAQHHARWLARVVHALPGHHTDVLVHVLGPEFVPFVNRRGAHPSAKVVRHALGQLQHAPPPAGRYC